MWNTQNSNNSCEYKFLLSDGLSLLMNKLSFNSNKYLLDSLPRNLKSSCNTLWSQTSMWSLIKRLNEMLYDSSKFKKLNVKPGKEINFLLQQEDRLTNFLKKVKKSISEQLYKELYPRGSQPGIMYGLSKIHKPLINNFPKLHHILSAINTATCSWAKFFVPLNVSL